MRDFRLNPVFLGSQVAMLALHYPGINTVIWLSYVFVETGRLYPTTHLK